MAQLQESSLGGGLVKNRSCRPYPCLLRILLTVVIATLFMVSLPISQANSKPAIIKQQTLKEGIIDIQYPLVILENAAAAEKINAVLAEKTAQFRSEVSKDPRTLVAHSRYDLHYNADNILSLSITDYVFTGGAHGMSYRKGYTFDLASGELYKFSDLVPDSAREQINREITRQIGANDIPMLQPFTEIKREPDFYLLPDRKLAIFYQLYELAPYAWGFVTFPISY